MAYTKIIPIKTNLNRAINYITNADKTDEQILVGALNCRAEKAYSQMQNIKSHYDKKDGRLGYHLIQSFKHDEINPDAAFKTAEKYANHYKGDKYQVIFATHIDKEHIHNHILWNSVSFADGMKYHADKNEYKDKIRRISDEICKENNLSIIEPDIANTVNKHYAEWLADKQGHPTWRSLIKTDVDDAMNWAIQMSEFYVDLKMKGYKVDTSGKYVTIICKGMKRPVRLKSLGKEYLRDEIQRKIEDNSYGINKETYSPKKSNYQYIKPPSKYAGWLVWFWWYKQYHQAMRERARPVHRIVREDLIKSMKFLRTHELVFKYQITDKSTLIKAINHINDEISSLIELRIDMKKDKPIKNEGKINIINIRLRKLRLELHLTKNLHFYAKAIERKVCTIQPRHKKKSRIRERTR